jgi:hypothetical protein
LGHKRDVRFDDHEALIPFAFGLAQLRASDGELRLEAFAPTPGSWLGSKRWLAATWSVSGAATGSSSDGLGRTAEGP